MMISLHRVNSTSVQLGKDLTYYRTGLLNPGNTIVSHLPLQSLLEGCAFKESKILGCLKNIYNVIWLRFTF